MTWIKHGGCRWPSLGYIRFLIWSMFLEAGLIAASFLNIAHYIGIYPGSMWKSFMLWDCVTFIWVGRRVGPPCKHTFILFMQHLHVMNELYQGLKLCVSQVVAALSNKWETAHFARRLPRCTSAQLIPIFPKTLENRHQESATAKIWMTGATSTEL